MREKFGNLKSVGIPIKFENVEGVGMKGWMNYGRRLEKKNTVYAQDAIVDDEDNDADCQD